MGSKTWDIEGSMSDNSVPGPSGNIRAIIDDLIEEGARLRQWMVLSWQDGQGRMPDLFQFGRDETTAEMVTRLHVWANSIQSCTLKWRPHKLERVNPYVHSMQNSVLPGGVFGAKHGGPLLCIDRLLTELRSIVPHMEIMSADIERQAIDALTGDELDHASQLLEIPGRHEEAILRAAGIIAGVVLERHLKALARQVHATLPEQDRLDLDK